MRVIDVHTHLSKLHKSKYSESHEKNLRYLLAEAKQNKVDRLLIIAGLANADGTKTSVKGLVKLAGGNAKISIIGSFDLAQNSKKELRELENLLKEKKIVGIKIYTGYQHFYPTDKRCAPIYKLCEKYNVPVIFHSGDTLMGYIKDPKLKYSHPLHIDDLATDRPNLKIVIAHMGNPWLLDCAEVLYKNPNVYADISGLVIGTDLNTPYGRLMKKRLLELIDYSEGNKLMYGTDWPLCPMKTYLKFVKSLGLSKTQLEGLMHKNAEKIFGLK
ncbi:MAG: amidohydrolase 2 [Parcubacteria group bacterium Gr01-1014_19]|nr:MAG: amidohydrolase 2 [Parcubacteria group bacterium Gr01-1014_19]